MPTAITHLLQPGDCLVYYSRTLLDVLIQLKTWTKAAHVEGYVGGGFSVASRNGKGVGVYPFRAEGLISIRRPNTYFDFSKAMTYFYKVDGQKYDWLGLLCFTLAVKQGAKNKQFCSEFLTRWYRHGGLHPFDANWDADMVAPAQFLQSPSFKTIYVG